MPHTIVVRHEGGIVYLARRDGLPVVVDAHEHVGAWRVKP